MRTKNLQTSNDIHFFTGPGVPPTRGRGVFPVTALMSHGCVSNARYIMMVDDREDGSIKVLKRKSYSSEKLISSKDKMPILGVQSSLNIIFDFIAFRRGSSVHSNI